MTDPLVLDAGRVFDGTAGDPIADGRVVVRGGRVEAVGTRESVPRPDDAAHDSYPSATVIPGLVDAHCHLVGARSMDPVDWTRITDSEGAARATADLRAMLEAGFTGARDCGSPVALGLKRAVADGEVPGPRVFSSGRAISQTGGHGDTHSLPHDWIVDGKRAIATLADGVPECRTAARKRVRQGADLLKIMTTGGVLSRRDHPTQTHYTDGEVAAMVDEAHRFDIPVAAHAQGTQGVKMALRNGVDTIEHGFWLDEEAIDRLVEAILVPTLAIAHRICEHGVDHGVPEHGVEKATEAREAHVDSVRRAHEAGVPIALGTDFVGPELAPHGENALEAELLVELVGMDERDAVRAGTGVAARTLPVDDVGTLEPGAHADAVVLDGDPFTDITALREVRTVYKSGEPVA